MTALPAMYGELAGWFHLLSARAGVLALDGHPKEALTLYRDALRRWRTLMLAWDEALTAIDMATLLDPAEPEVQAAADIASATLTRFGARPYLERLKAKMTRTGTGGSTTDPARPEPAAEATEAGRSR